MKECVKVEHKVTSLRWSINLVKSPSKKDSVPLHICSSYGRFMENSLPILIRLLFVTRWSLGVLQKRHSTHGLTGGEPQHRVASCLSTAFPRSCLRVTRYRVTDTSRNSRPLPTSMKHLSRQLNGSTDRLVATAGLRPSSIPMPQRLTMRT